VPFKQEKVDLGDGEGVDDSDGHGPDVPNNAKNNNSNRGLNSTASSLNKNKQKKKKRFRDVRYDEVNWPKIESVCAGYTRAPDGPPEVMDAVEWNQCIRLDKLYRPQLQPSLLMRFVFYIWYLACCLRVRKTMMDTFVRPFTSLDGGPLGHVSNSSPRRARKYGPRSSVSGAGAGAGAAASSSSTATAVSASSTAVSASSTAYKTIRNTKLITMQSQKRYVIVIRLSEGRYVNVDSNTLYRVYSSGASTTEVLVASKAADAMISSPLDKRGALRLRFFSTPAKVSDVCICVYVFVYVWIQRIYTPRHIQYIYDVT